LDELALQIPGDELRIGFHPELTVLHGLSAVERAALIDNLLGAVACSGDAARIAYAGTDGRRVLAGTTPPAYEDDGTPAPLLVAPAMAPDAGSLRELLVLGADDIAASSGPREDDPPELADARATLAQMSGELREALEARHYVDQLHAELVELDVAIRQAEDDAARREYARVLAQLERVRAEAAALQTGSAGVDSDRRLIERAAGVHALASRWAGAVRRLDGARTRFGDRARLDDEALARARAIPDTPPADLSARLDDARHAREVHDVLDARLRELAGTRLPHPSTPAVVELAHADQDAVWRAHARVLAANAAVHDAELAAGGLATEGPTPAVIAEIEDAHSRLELAENMLEQRRLTAIIGAAIGVVGVGIGLMSSFVVAVLALAASIVMVVVAYLVPRRRAEEAQRFEQSLLERIGATTYLAFHLRRVDAAVDPHVRTQLDAVMAERRDAYEAWRSLVGDIAPEQATPLEAEVRAYAAAVLSLGGAADEIESLRVELTTSALPALHAADHALGEVLEAYGLDAERSAGYDAIAARIEEQLVQGVHARMQLELVQAEADAADAAAALEGALLDLGFADGELDACLGALDWALDRAREREEARSRARDRKIVEADLARLQQEVQQLRRPEWDTVTAADASGPDVETLLERRAEVESCLASAPRVETDVERLADRHSAMERRVAALEARYGGIDPMAVGALADVQQYVLGHLSRAAHAGPQGDAVPVVLDEVFARIPPERKWELLDMVLRLGEKTQLIYLTDDPYVGAWARQQALDGAITLLEPVAA
jgi:hypothetical protein